MKTIGQSAKSLLIVIILLLVQINGMQAQKKWKDYLVSGSAMFVSGMLDGTIESISYHYENGFKQRLPNANDQFWNPAVSWKNKYYQNNPQMGPKFLGSTTIFACTTDAYHLLRTTKRSIDGANLVYYMNKECKSNKTFQKRWKSEVKDFLILTAIRCAGFHLTYSLAFRRQPGI